MTFKKGIVAKFGGSSVKDAEAMKRCAQVVESFPDTRIVIISATHNTTNQLETVAQLAVLDGEEKALNLLSEIQKRHLTIADDLAVLEDTRENLLIIFKEASNVVSGVARLKECSEKTMDLIYSFGERMSSLLFSDVLRKTVAPKKQAIFYDIREVLKTSSDWGRAKPILDLTKKHAQTRLMPLLNQGNTIIVTQGFIGQTLKGETTTLGREGSDFSAALMAEACDAEILQIWTDVPGIATTDPRLVKTAKVIKELSCSEASAMAKLGSKVLYEDTMNPVMRAGIPVFVGSSLKSQEGGTWIRDWVSERPYLRSLSVMKDVILMALTNKGHLSSEAFLKSVLDVFSKYRLPDEINWYKGEVLTCIIPKQKYITDDFKTELSELAEIELESSLTLISIIGNIKEYSREKNREINQVILSNNIYPRAIFAGTGPNVILSILLPTQYYEDSARELHGLI